MKFSGSKDFNLDIAGSGQNVTAGNGINPTEYSRFEIIIKVWSVKNLLIATKVEKENTKVMIVMEKAQKILKLNHFFDNANKSDSFHTFLILSTADLLNKSSFEKKTIRRSFWKSSTFYSNSPFSQKSTSNLKRFRKTKLFICARNRFDKFRGVWVALLIQQLSFLIQKPLKTLKMKK